MIWNTHMINVLVRQSACAAHTFCAVCPEQESLVGIALAASAVALLHRCHLDLLPLHRCLSCLAQHSAVSYPCAG